jgi:hypothetical protein
MKALLALMVVSGSALANDAAITQCRSQADGPARLACYDAIQVGAQPQSTSQRLAAPAAAAGAVATQPTRRELEQSFGMEALKPAAKLDEVASHIEGKFDGWRANQQIRLANGQVWRVVDDSSGITKTMTNPAVKVVRGALGAMYLEIDGTNQSPKVRRVQ